jgi:hypothetical protein
MRTRGVIVPMRFQEQRQHPRVGSSRYMYALPLTKSYFDIFPCRPEGARVRLAPDH